MKKLTILQEGVKKQIQRINRLIRRYKNQGFENVPDELTFDRSKARTSQLQRLKGIGRKELLKKATYSGEETGGEKIEANKLSKLREKIKKEKNKKVKEKQKNFIPTFSDLYELRARIEALPSSRGLYTRKYTRFSNNDSYSVDLTAQKDELLSSIDEVLAQDDKYKQAYSEYIKEHASEIELYTSVWVYDSQESNVRSAVSKLLAIIKARPLSKIEQENLNSDYGEDDEEEADVELYNKSNILYNGSANIIRKFI